MPGCDSGPSVKSRPFVIFKNKQKTNQQPQQKLLLIEIEIVMNNSQTVEESGSVGLAAPGAEAFSCVHVHGVTLPVPSYNLIVNSRHVKAIHVKYTKANAMCI